MLVAEPEIILPVATISHTRKCSYPFIRRVEEEV
jgi:hypothetical protein